MLAVTLSRAKPKTQDISILFVPSELLYADLHEFFDDVIQRAHKSRIIVVSPSLLMMAVQVMQAIVHDARVREEAHVIQAEVRYLVEESHGFACARNNSTRISRSPKRISTGS